MADKKTQDYWTSYYGEYGEMLVREIPRLIKAAFLPEFKRSASKSEIAVIPFGMGQTDAGDVRVDGVIRDTASKTAFLFVATINEQGELLDIEHKPAPCA
jgi:hypothetical protein